MDCHDSTWSSTVRIPHGGIGKIYANNPTDGTRMAGVIATLVNAIRSANRSNVTYDSFGFLEVPQDIQGPDALEWRQGVNGNTDAVLGEYRFVPQRATWQIRIEWSGCLLEIEFPRIGPALWALNRFGRALECYERLI